MYIIFHTELSYDRTTENFTIQKNIRHYIGIWLIEREVRCMLEFILGFAIGSGFGFLVFSVLSKSRAGEDAPDLRSEEDYDTN